jgi:hypothetical protein
MEQVYIPLVLAFGIIQLMVVVQFGNEIELINKIMILFILAGKINIFMRLFPSLACLFKTISSFLFFPFYSPIIKKPESRTFFIYLLKNKYFGFLER